MSDRPASAVLAEFLTLIRQSPEYLNAKYTPDAPAAECLRICESSLFRTDGFPADVPRGSDAPWGTVCGQKFTLEFVQVWRDYAGYAVEVTLHPDGTGAVWLGVCNNSTRHDIKDPAEAWYTWAARRVGMPSPVPDRSPAVQKVVDSIADQIDTLPVPEADPADTTVLGKLRLYQTQHPQSYRIAADHHFGCTCMPCLVFHALAGLELGEPDWESPADENGNPSVIVRDPRWVTLAAEPAPVTLTADQSNRLMRLARELL